jgi:D-alanyl-D-alanine carboxypeptidase
MLLSNGTKMADLEQPSQQHASDETATITPSGLTKNELEAGIERILSGQTIPTIAVITVSPKGTTTTAKGARKHGHNTRVMGDDSFMIGPMSSTMVSVVLASLIEQGVLNWSNTLQELFPDLLNAMDPAHYNTTLKMLSSHVSGITTKFPELGNGRLPAELLSVGGHEGRRRTLVSVLSNPPERKPGPGSSYRNAVNLMLLAFIIERVTGLSWDEVMQKEVFASLGMGRSGVVTPESFQDADSGEPTKPWPHEISSDSVNPVPLDQVKRGPWLTCAATYPALGVHSRLDDIGTYLNFCLHGAGELLSSEGRRVLYTLEPESGSDFSAGGFDVFHPEWVDEPVLKCRGHVSGFTTGIWIAPKLGFAFAVIVNVDGKAGAAAVDSVYELIVAS